MEEEEIYLREVKRLKILRIVLWVLYFGVIILTFTLAIIQDVRRHF